MEKRMSRWGVGPRISVVAVAYALVAGAATYAWPDVCLLQFLPRAVFVGIAVVLLAIGIPMLLVAGATVMRAYNRDELVTSGIFAVVRHPIYSAWIVWIVPGLVLLTQSWPLLLTPCVAFLRFKAVIRREDEYLHQRFGPAYDAYRSRVNELFPFPHFQPHWHAPKFARAGRSHVK